MILLIAFGAVFTPGIWPSLFYCLAGSGWVQENNFDGIDRVGGQSGLYFFGNIYDVNIPSRTVTVSWLIVACGNYTSSTMYGSYNCSAPNIPVAVYINGAPRPDFTYDPTLQPHLNEDNDKVASSIQGLIDYQTKHSLHINTHKFIGSDKAAALLENLDHSYIYPFDTFYLAMNVVAMVPNTSTSAALPVISLGFSSHGNTLNPNTNDVATTTIVNGTVVSSRYALLTLKRKGFTVLFVILIYFINNVLTAAVAGVTTFAFWSKSPGITDGMVGLPVTVILTLPALRALSMESPPIGIMLDFGFLFQMMVVSTCSVALLLKFTLRSREKAEKGPLPLLPA